MNSSSSSFMDKRKKTNILRAMTTRKKRTWSYKLVKKWRNLDMYGQKVHLTYKGHKKFKTSIGALFTVITRTLLVLFMAYELSLLYTQSHAINNTKYFIRNPNSDAINLKEHGFDLAFGVSKAIDESYGVFKAYQIETTGQAKTYVYESIFMFWVSKSEQFIRVENIKITDDNLDIETKIVASLNLKLDRRSVQFGILIDFLIGALEKIGGFKEGIINSKAFKEDKNQEQSNRTSTAKMNANDQEKFSSVKTVKINDSVTMDILDKKQPEKNKDLETLTSRVHHQNKLTNEQSNTVFNEVIGRSRFIYKTTDVIKYLVKCLCWRRSKKLKKDPNTIQHFMYKKANEKIEQELDIVNLVRSIRKLRLMTKVMLTHRSNILLKFQRKNLIECESSSSDSDHHRFDTMKLMDSKNELVKLSVVQKIKRNLNSLTEVKLDQIDKNLIRGLYHIKTQQNEENTTITDGDRLNTKLFQKFGTINLSSMEHDTTPINTSQMPSGLPRLPRFKTLLDVSETQNDLFQVENSPKVSVRQRMRSSRWEGESQIIENDSNISQRDDDLISPNKEIPSSKGESLREFEN
ncbi:UNKNOWN [Stylonychia lemnae]|uniref:Uncharacterized protein n=1 Tax=Stylonychia lemnae TaxID=5949 RepID=A0A078AAE1_STYLE|nr:UNKNOWN [Stylonychia lemnae]|eukprot:CDW79230.1 UNKNOWN [Stylonychia lemnae]